MFDLHSRIALVTGGARGIGRDIARVLARCGAEVYATDIDGAALDDTVAALRAEALTVHGCRHDVADPAAWTAVLDRIGEAHGHLDILVNNAGIMQSKPFLQTSLDDFRRTQRINVDSVFIGIQAAVPLLKRSAEHHEAGASVINLSSIFGQIGGDMNAAYCASKGAVRMLSKALAVELGRAGLRIRVNTVHPGGVDTDLGRGGLQAFIEHGALPDIESAAAMLQMATPLGRIAQVEDVSGVVAFLASDAARFMTGSEVTVDGGFSIN
jgi:3alpha(or 20beta)-hydroxysteroid dehydrogenase